ncbi:MAG TPA: L-rhamnose/proton symporter RhaT [Terriglobia bacterium]|nr:L-rhamnose/proton symporter RhaT [Terriglobia bacterium]
MIEHFWLGMAIIFLSGALNGSFALPMKYARHWRWENTWLVFAIVALAVLPWLLAAGFVPHLGELYRHTPRQVLIYPLVFGFFWGIAQTTFGIGISAVGMALAFAVVSGLACLSGSLVPLLALNPAELFQPRGILLLIGIPILFLGLFFYGKAGHRREREQPSRPSEQSGIRYSFAAGLGICIFTGIVGSAWNLGFAFSGPLIRRSTELGAASLTAPYAVWALILGAGFIPNLLYCIYLLSRNGTWSLFGCAGWGKELWLSLAMALLWFPGIIGYGIGATFVGKYGTSIGFTLFIAAQILSANTLGILSGEWKSTSTRTKRVLTAAVVFTLLSVMVLNLGGIF